MKKKLIICLFLPFGFLPLTSHGQISSGTTLLGGSLGFTTNANKSNETVNQEYRSNNFYISPQAGYFIADNLVVGASLGLSNGSQKSNSKKVFEQKGFSAGPFVRYYKFLGEKTALFGNAALNFNQTKVKTQNSVGELTTFQKQEGFSAILTPGLTYFASSKVGLEISLGSIGYSTNSSESNLNSSFQNTSKHSGFFKYYGLANSALGVNFYLGR
jgi:hypothetical protein